MEGWAILSKLRLRPIPEFCWADFDAVGLCHEVVEGEIEGGADFRHAAKLAIAVREDAFDGGFRETQLTGEGRVCEAAGLEGGFEDFEKFGLHAVPCDAEFCG